MIRAVLFDLDGTLVDTAPDMAWALNRVRDEEGLPPLPFEIIRQHVSHGGKALIQLAFPDLGESEREPLRERFLKCYRENLYLDSALFPGFTPVLARLESTGYRWGVVTNKPAWLTEPLMEALGLDRQAACIVSGDTTPRRKPDPLPLLHAARSLALAPGECLYVGDAPRDIEAGNAAGMATLVALWGYLGPDDTPETWGADGMIEEPRQILEHLPGTGAGNRATVG